jgi:glutamate dehydrogenase
MPSKAHEQKDERIEKAAAYLKERLDPALSAEAEPFLRAFYHRVAPEDVADYTIENMYGAALALWKFAAEREPGRPKIRVYNPNLEEHGWKSPHTVVEIVNDDMPFLVDSVTSALTELALTVHITIHPQITVQRNAKGKRTALLDATGTAVKKKGALAESVMHIEINEQSDPQVLSGIEESLAKVLSDVRAAVEDWSRMQDKLADAIDDLEKHPPPLEREEVDEGKYLLQWMGDNHFTFLGYREYDYAASKGQEELKIVSGTGLGILRDETTRVMGGRHGGATMTPEVREFLRRPEMMIVTKANARSTVHRPVYLDYVGVKTFDKSGKVVGERRFIGLFTSAAYNRNPRDIPFLRRKVAQVVERSSLGPTSHDGKALLNILEQYPRDELFQIAVGELTEIAIGILHLQERPRIRLFARRDKFERFVSCLVFVPRERYNTELRRRMQAILRDSFEGRDSAFYTQLGDSPLARLHFIVGTTPGQVPTPDLEQLEARLVDAARSWSDDLADALIERWGEEGGNRLYHRYGAAFPSAYREVFNTQNALHDIEKLELLDTDETLALNLYRPLEEPEHTLRFKIYNYGRPVPLSDCLPMLERMGFKVMEENPYAIGEATPLFWIHDFHLVDPSGQGLELGDIKAKLEEAFAKVWHGEMESDGFNRLVLRAGLSWREVIVLRAYSKYLRQTGMTFSQDYMEDTLSGNPVIAGLLVTLFRLSFDPEENGERAKHAGELQERIKAELDNVASLDEDRILRSFLNLVQSTLRTNYFQRADGGGPKAYLSFKLDSAEVLDLPAPRPYREIFVYSPRTEAIHLRGGSVARGGIRWSDRREDFRTEILGLMKAQMVKNSVIVPVGAKGGFVAKRLPVDGDRDAVMAEVVACYRTMMCGLLDITDNLAGGDVVPPADTVRHDGDDPYLVVAADKGTATFSDTANGIAGEYGFWLGDAFASGGSAGYDHKKMGITARGAWESVKRHFREMGRDIQNSPFTAIGVGDMSGDVFGNGMLLSRHTRLLAAFDHRHIFIDPDPDAESSFEERKRLFELPRSSWEDYDAKLISKDGGVFKRSAKSIALTPGIKKLFNIKRDSVTPNELIHFILMCKADLLWFGGIGTYVKSSHESNSDVGDRTNDAVRVDAKDLHCLVIGEGANLGVTQRGRIEYALNGGRVNSDAVDNSAGVDCSDHEVNIKILLGAVVTDGEMTGKQRDRLLAEMTDEVGDLVLQDNYLQTQALTVTQSDAEADLEPQVHFMRALERAGRLDRAIEFLPDDEELADRRAARTGLTRPEASVIMAYAKTTLYADLLETDLPDDPYLAADLAKYFPRPLRRKFKPMIGEHRLRREIITTVMANSMVNRAGLTFVYEMTEETGAGVASIARAYAIVRDAFKLRPLWTAIEGLDNQVPAEAQVDMIRSTKDVIRRDVLWFLRSGVSVQDIAAAINAYAPGIEALSAALEDVLSGFEAEAYGRRTEQLTGQGVPEDLAKRIAGLEPLGSALDIVRAATVSERPVEDVGRVYFGVGSRLNLNWLRSMAEEVAPKNHWERHALATIVDDLYDQQRWLTNAVLATADGKGGDDAIDAWEEHRAAAVGRANKLITEIRDSGVVDVAKLTIASGHIRGMIGNGQAA